MVQLVLQRRDYLKASTALGGVPELLAKIREVLLYTFFLLSRHPPLRLLTNETIALSFHPQSPDFYMEMKWEFTSWSKFFVHIVHLGYQQFSTQKKKKVSSSVV